MERQEDLDIAKGIGIILVVWAHAQGPFTDFINSFHMPLFFFISGMLYRSNRSISEFTKRRAVRLLLPFWTYNFLMYPFFCIMYYWRRWDFSIIAKEIIEILMTVNKVPFLGATWFLPALFWASIIVHILQKKFEKWILGDICLFLFGLLVAFIGFYITLPYRLSRNLILFLFYISGYLYYKYLGNKTLSVYRLFACPLMLLVGIYLSGKYPSSIEDNMFSSKLTFLLAAFLLILFVLFISVFLLELKKYRIIEAIINILSWGGATINAHCNMAVYCI